MSLCTRAPDPAKGLTTRSSVSVLTLIHWFLGLRFLGIDWSFRHFRLSQNLELFLNIPTSLDP